MIGKRIRNMAAAGIAAVMLVAAGGCVKTAGEPVQESIEAKDPSKGEEKPGTDTGQEIDGRQAADKNPTADIPQGNRGSVFTSQRTEDTLQKEGRASAGVSRGGEMPPDKTGGIPQTETKLSAHADGFVVLSEAVPDIVQEIRYYSTYNFVGERIDGYEAPCALLTKEAASALKEVSDDVMEQGYRLKVYDAYRPQMAVDHFVRWAKDPEDTRMKPYFYPEVEKSRLFEQGYISAKSGHSRGSTIDLTLLDMETGKEADMGGVFDYFGKRSHPDYVGNLTAEQQKNRRILREAMLRHGFKAISTEWWHFTLREEPYPDTYFNFPVS